MDMQVKDAIRWLETWNNRMVRELDRAPGESRYAYSTDKTPPALRQARAAYRAAGRRHSKAWRDYREASKDTAQIDEVCPE